MAIDLKLIDKLLADYKNREDIIGENGLLRYHQSLHVFNLFVEYCQHECRRRREGIVHRR